MNCFRKLLAAFAGVAFCFGPAPGQEPRKADVGAPKTARSQAAGNPFGALFLVQTYQQVAISPDGKKVAWVETQIDKNGARTRNQDLYVVEYEQSQTPQRVTAGASTAHFNEKDLAWSPDSQQLAFLSDAAKKGQLQLYVMKAEGGKPRQVTSTKGLLATPKWSPDGQSIAILHTENATREAGPLVAETAETGVIKDVPEIQCTRATSWIFHVAVAIG